MIKFILALTKGRSLKILGVAAALGMAYAYHISVVTDARENGLKEGLQQAHRIKAAEWKEREEGLLKLEKSILERQGEIEAASASLEDARLSLAAERRQVSAFYRSIESEAEYRLAQIAERERFEDVETDRLLAAVASLLVGVGSGDVRFAGESARLEAELRRIADSLRNPDPRPR